MEMEVLFRQADGSGVAGTVAVLEKVSMFKPYRSKGPPRDPNRTDYCDLDLTDASYLSRDKAKWLKFFPRRIRTPRVLMETVVRNSHYCSSPALLSEAAAAPRAPKPVPLVPYSDSNDDDECENPEDVEEKKRIGFVSEELGAASSRVLEIPSGDHQTGTAVVPNGDDYAKDKNIVEKKKIKIVLKKHKPRVTPEPSCGRIDHDRDEDYVDGKEKEEEKIKKAKTMTKKKKRKNSTRSASGPAEEKKKKKRCIKKKVIDGPNPPPPMPEAMRERIERGEEWLGGGLVLLLQKQLYESDLNSQQNRLSVPINQLESLDFLRDEEKAAAIRREGGKIAGIKGVRLMDPRLAEYTVHFKQWDLNSSSSYMITNKWSRIVTDNDFNKGEIVQLWFFRDKHDEPCFALAKLPHHDNDQ